MTRGDARELAVHLIYAHFFTGEEPEVLVASRMEREYYKKLAEENQVYTERPSHAQMGYIDTVVTGVTNRQDELNEYIRKYSIGWDVSRISRLARAILQLAIFEMLYIDDVPVSVAASEAVRLAKKYDGDDTSAFVNGILGSFSRNMDSGEVK